MGLAGNLHEAEGFAETRLASLSTETDSATWSLVPPGQGLVTAEQELSLPRAGAPQLAADPTPPCRLLGSAAESASLGGRGLGIDPEKLPQG